MYSHLPKLTTAAHLILTDTCTTGVVHVHVVVKYSILSHAARSLVSECDGLLAYAGPMVFSEIKVHIVYDGRHLHRYNIGMY